MLAKRFKAEQKQTLFGYLRYLSDNNAPLLNALNRLFEKKSIGLAEMVAIDTGFYALFRSTISAGTLPKLSSGETINPLDLEVTVFEYSRQLFMSIVEQVQKIDKIPTTVALLHSIEDYIERDFICAYSLRHIINPVYVVDDLNVQKVCQNSPSRCVRRAIWTPNSASLLAASPVSASNKSAVRPT